MTSAASAALRHLSGTVGADAAVLWRSAEGVGAPVVLISVPEGLAESRSPWALAEIDPSDELAPVLVAEPGELARYLPMTIRLALPEPASAVLVVPIVRPEPGGVAARGPLTTMVLIWCDSVPPDDVVESVQSTMDHGLAVDLELWDAQLRWSAAQAKLAAIGAALEQAVVIVDDTGGPGEVNPAAGRLLGLPPGYVAADRLAEALRCLTERSNDRAALEARAAALRASPDTVVRDWIWRLDGSPSHLRVTTSPIRGRGLSSRVWIFDDVSEVVSAGDRYRLLAENSSDVVLLTRGGVVQWISPALTTVLGWTPTEWEGDRIETYTHPDEVALVLARREEVEQGNVRVITLRLRAKSGEYHWVEVHAGPFVNADGEQDGIVASFRVTDDEVEAEQELQRRATIDDLTGAVKRDVVLAHLDERAQHASRGGDLCAVLVCDIDYFKSVNDAHGHGAGDEVLRTHVKRIRSCVREDDMIARMGGDEFLVILSGVHDLDQAVGIAEKVRLAAEVPISIEDGSVTSTLSIGVTLSGPGEPADRIVARADDAMYEGKRAGRNRVIPISN